MTDKKQIKNLRFRSHFLLAVLLCAGILLIWRGIDLHVVRHDFLQGQGDARALRVVEMAAHRGMITDRDGEPLAISTPVDSIWANPQELILHREKLAKLSKTLGMRSDRLLQLLTSKRGREFVYLKRRAHPELADKVMALKIPGVALKREYKRYYPAGEVTGHLIGFTDVDDTGQEGIELAFDDWLRGTAGSKRVIKDRLGQIIKNVENIRIPQPGGNIALSIDRRIQFVAYSALKSAVTKHKARSGSAVVLDVESGEILAMVNQPAFNPNMRRNIRADRYRNRAVTDVFEPGSTLKPFTIAAGLESGKYRPSTKIKTGPGFYKVGRSTIRDHRNYGTIDVSTVIQKSSNVGSSKIALSLSAKQFWQVLARIGFGEITSSGFPGESSGQLTSYQKWREIDQATLSFGYGISTTVLQLAQAYSVLASDGFLRPLSLQRVDDVKAVHATQDSVLKPSSARQVRKMLERVVVEGGTGTRAKVKGYRVAGKTGTAKKAGVGGYLEDRYVSLFAGMAPASNPRLVMVVMINDPSGGVYYGGEVAAPVFANVMADALRLLNVAPDDLQPTDKSLLTAKVGARP